MIPDLERKILQSLATHLFEYIDEGFSPLVYTNFSEIEEQEFLREESGKKCFSQLLRYDKDKAVSVCLQVDNGVYNKYHKMKTSTNNGYNSFIENLVYAFIEEAFTYLNKKVPKPFFFTYRNRVEILCRAAMFFMGTIEGIGGGNRKESLYNVCSNVSQLGYEKTEISGNLIVSNKFNKNVVYKVKFKEPFDLSDIRRLRKVMELTRSDQSIITDSYLAYGLGFVREPDELPAVIVISFEGKNKWKVSQNDRVLMVVHDGIPNVYREKINRESFLQKLVKVNSELTEEQKENLYSIAEAASKLPHGGLIVISDKAEDEAKRLGNQGLPIEPIKLEPDLIKQFTSIDGAVLMDWDCNCYAIGVILDGIASEYIGNSTRGSRYNSAARYCNYRSREDKVIAIVISEDGMVNVVPESTN